MTYDKTALFVINPVAGKKKIQGYLTEVIQILNQAGYKVMSMVTGKSGDAHDYAYEFGKGADLVLCAGGDGTMNETLSGLMDAGAETPMGYLPCGTYNDISGAKGLSKDPLEQAKSIVTGEIKAYDVGRFGDRYFCNVAAFGAFSWMAYTTDQEMKNLLGYRAYVLDALMDPSRLKPIPMRITADGVVYEGEYIFGAISNSPTVAGAIDLPDGVDICDGKLELTLVRASETMLETQQLVHSMVSREYNPELFTMVSGQHFVIENPTGALWSLDGESSGSFDRVEVEALKGRLHLKG